MAIITIRTIINAPIDRCYNLSRSIDLHKLSALETEEEVIAGRSKGLIEMGETVTWRAKHFGLWHKMKVQITKMEEPDMFVDEMVWGSFKFMRHSHNFKSIESGTEMTDKFEFESPFGYLGKLVDAFFLKSYMRNFLIDRNNVIKEFAETDKWKLVFENEKKR